MTRLYYVLCLCFWGCTEPPPINSPVAPQLNTMSSINMSSSEMTVLGPIAETENVNNQSDTDMAMGELWGEMEIAESENEGIESQDNGMTTIGEVQPDMDQTDSNTENEASDPQEESSQPSYLDILDDVPGWATGTYGGRDGEVYTVTTLDFSGSGSLKEALESDAPLWIIFSPDLNGEILLEEVISVKSFKTVDARNHQITLKAIPEETGLRFGDQNQEGIEQVIFLNVTFDGGWDDYREDAEGRDGINIRNGTHHVWIHQCTFFHWSDGAIDAKTDDGYPLPHHISITNNLFTRIHQPLAVAIDRLTFARNHCLDVTKRCIQVNFGGTAHMINNVIEDWRSREIIAAKDDAQLLVDNNMFAPGRESDVAGAALKEDTDERGRWQNENSHMYGGWVSFQRSSLIDTSLYTEARRMYEPDICEIFDLGCWSMLYEQVVRDAGAHP